MRSGTYTIKSMNWRFIMFSAGVITIPAFVFAQQVMNLQEMASLLQSLQEMVSSLTQQVSSRLPSVIAASPFETDVTKDGINNADDWRYLESRWFSNDSVADINGDGVVNSIDFGLLNRNWNKTAP